MSVERTTYELNGLLEAQGCDWVGVSAVANCIGRLQPLITPVFHVPQGSVDEESRWAKARHRFASQLLIRLGEWNPDLAELKKDGLVDEDATEIPRCYDKSVLPPLKLEAIAFWDETHREIRVGYVTQGDGRREREYALRW